MAWPGLILSGFVWPDPVFGLSDTWPVQLRLHRCCNNVGAWHRFAMRRRQRQRLRRQRQRRWAGRRRVCVCGAVCVCGGCVGAESAECVVPVVCVGSVVFVEAVWARNLWLCVGVEFVACVFVCRWWIGLWMLDWRGDAWRLDPLVSSRSKSGMACVCMWLVHKF